MTNYAAELQTRSSPAYIARAVARSKQLYQQYGGWIDKYRGGMPAGFMSLIMMWESDGKPGTVGDASLGEYGLYQIAAYIPPLFGLPADSRYNPEVNVFLAGLEYQYEAARWKAKFPNHVSLGGGDAWKLARLSFSVGAGGAWGLAANAINAGYVSSGDVYAGIVRYVDATGGIPLGSQSKEKVWFRTKSIAIQWEIGQQAGGLLDWAGPPTRIQAPPGYSYTIPKAVQPYFASSFPYLLFGAVGLGGLILWRSL